VLTTYEDQFSAEAEAGRLREEGIPVEVRVKSLLPGIVSEALVLVPNTKVSRAHQIISRFEISEAELNFAATGESNSEGESSTVIIQIAESPTDRHRFLFIALLAAAAICFVAVLQRWPGPWQIAGRVLLLLATAQAIRAFIEAITAGKSD
jgi:hypothetical protein